VTYANGYTMATSGIILLTGDPAAADMRR